MAHGLTSDWFLQLLASVILSALAFFIYRRWMVSQNDNTEWLLRFIIIGLLGASFVLILSVFRSL